MLIWKKKYGSLAVNPTEILNTWTEYLRGALLHGHQGEGLNEKYEGDIFKQ